MTEIASLFSTGLAALAVLFAVIITWTSLRAFRQTRSATHRFAFAGFVFLTGGILAEELLFRFTNLYLHTVHTFESLLFVVGFGFLYLSIR